MTERKHTSPREPSPATEKATRVPARAAGHTPGPWDTEPFGRVIATCGSVSRGSVWANTHELSAEEVRANARLIAAAPALLEAARRVMTAGRGTSGRIILEAEDEAVVEAAIHLATGGEDA